MTDHTTHFDDCGCLRAKLKAERDALRLRVAAMEAAGNAMKPLLIGRAFEEYGCQFCGKYLCAPDCKVKQAENAWTAALSGNTTALRAIVLRAIEAGDTNVVVREGPEQQDSVLMDEHERIADRILGASKEGGE